MKSMNEGILPEEQKGCKNKSEGTGDRLYINKMLLWEVKRRKKNLAMGWIDYRKAYDVVPNFWVIESLNMMGIVKNVVNFLGKTMMSWGVKLTCGAETFWEIPIKRVIFQGDALSPLLLATALIPLIHTLRTTNPGYEFQTGETINHILFMSDIDIMLYTKQNFLSFRFSL